MRTILVICLWLFGVELPLIRGACPNGSSLHKVYIFDTDIGKEIFSIEAENTTFDPFTVQVTPGAILNATIASGYFRVGIRDKNLTLSTTETFKNLGSDADVTGTTTIGLTINVKIHDCPDLNFLVIINCSYANKPIFSESSYTYTLPMPVMPKSDFTVYGQKIAVSDINFANTNMTMAINSQDFDVSVVKIDNKHFEAVFSAKKYLRFTESQTFTLTAENSGSKQSEVNVTINVDAANGLDEPSFDKSYYFFEYSKDDTGNLKPKDSGIVVKTNKPNDAFYELTGDFKEYFVTTFDNSSKFSLALNPDKPLPSDVSSQIALTQIFTTDATGYTAIIVDVVTVIIIPSFSTDHYIGKYDIITNQIEWTPSKVEIKNATEVKLSDDVSDLLKINKSDYSIFPKTSLTKSNFDENLNMVFTITATSRTNDEARATVVLSFVPKELKFDKPYYSATYSEKNGKYVVTLDNGNDIGFSDVREFIGIEIQVGSDYTKNFEIKPDNSKWTISVSEPLSESTLLKNTKLYIPLTATWPTFEETASSVLILNLPEKSEVKFDKSYYTGSYVKGNDKDTVKLNEPIHLNGAKADDITIKVEGFEEIFKATYNPETSLCDITVESKLNSSIIGNASELVVTIVALSTERNLKTYAVLSLDLPLKSASIEFEKKHYHATYNDTDSTSTATITVTDGPIKLVNKDDLQLEFSFEGFDDTFIASYDPKTSLCEITLQSNLNSSIIGHESQLTITLVAVSTELHLKSFAVLILDLPVKTSSIEFEKKHYHATYNDTDSTSTATIIVTDGPIKLVNKDDLQLEFSFEGFDDTFITSYDPETSLCEITLQSNLNSSIIGHESQLTITLVAVSTELHLKSFAVLILDLPVKTPSIEFEKKHYHATYNDTDSTSTPTIAVTDGPIKLVNKDDLQLEFSFESFDDTFIASYDPKTSLCEISLQSNLNSSIIGHESQLTITLVAVSTELHLKSFAVLILDLPVKTSSIEFEKKHYHAAYNDTDATSTATITVTDGPIKLVNKDDLQLEFSFEGFDDTFITSYDPETSLCEITLQSNLNSSIIGHESQLTITLVAVSTELHLKSFAVLILDLPVKTPSIEFEKKHYHATYNDTDSTSTPTIAVTDGPIKLVNKDDLQLEFSFESFDDTFIASYDPKTSLCEISLQSNLNSSIIGHESQLTITLVAVSTELHVKSFAVLILDLPVKTSSIEFERKHYHATYNDTDSTSTATIIVTDGPIKLVNKDDLQLEFSFEGFDDTFIASYDPKTSLCEISLQSNLNSSIIGHESQLTITIVAVSTELSLQTYAVLILDLPVKTSSIEFEKKYYHANYNETGSTTIATVILLDGPIKINNNDQLELKISFEGYEDNFHITWDPKTSTCEITVQSSLDPNVIEENLQLVLTLTAVSVVKNLTSYTIVILDLPSKAQSIQFEKRHYFAAYEVSSDSVATVNIEDGPIKILNQNGMKLNFSFEDFENNFEMTYDAESSAYEISVVSSLDPTLLADKPQLIITVTAHNADKNLACDTTLILGLPSNSISFADEYYVAHYQTDPELKVNLTKEIVLDAKNLSKINFSFYGYDKNFQLDYIPSTKTYNIKAKSALDDSVLSAKTELLIILTAEETDSHKTASTVLVLQLPSYVNDVFESNHYTAEYNLRPDSDTDAISMIDMNVKIKSPEYTAISFTGYESNFKGTCDATTLECTITVQKNLNSTTLSSNEDLIITIVATSTLQPIPGKTVLVLKLPSKNSTFAFSKQYYNAVYSIQKSGREKATVDLEGLVSLTGVDAAGVNIVLDAYSDFFELSFDSASWKLNVRKNLGPEILSDKTELVASLTASKQDKSDHNYAKATLIIKLPDKTTVAFSKTQYYGEYLVDDKGGAEIVLDGDSEIETTDIDNTNIELNDFRELFLITLNSESKWSIGLQNPLNKSILSLYTELRLQMRLTKVGVSYGEAGLTIRLPPLTFSKDTYSGSYSVDENGRGSVDVEDITLGDIDASYVELKLTNYTEYLKLTQKVSSWNLEVADKLPETILNTKSELILTLTATKRNQTGSDHAKTTLLIKLPDDTSVAFNKPQYYGEYVIKDPSPVVVLDEDSEITITDSVNSKIELTTFENNFQISLDSQSKWSVNVDAPLNSSVLTKYSELRLLLTISKLGINYGEAGLFIRLPPLRFSEDQYSGLYSFVTSDVETIIVENITIEDVDTSYIHLELMEYTDNFYIEKNDDRWTIKVKTPLSTDITEKQLVTNLQAIRDSDNKILATTVLVISLPTINSTDAPVFSAVTFNGDYINSDTPTVKMNKLISLIEADSDSSPTVYIDASNEFSTNFSLVQEKGNQYSVKVEGRLSQEVLDEQTNIALTLVAKSTEGNFGYATLVISLPKAVRNTSVQVENHEILFTGTYKNGVFTSPKIPLVTNGTSNSDILVEMTNDLGIDSKYFSYTYSDGILAVNVHDIPPDVLKNTSVVPLKLAIKDRHTQDTIYAVLNVEISSDNGGDSGGGTDDGSPAGPDRLGLIVAVSILAGLLVLLVLLVSYFWFFRLRANKYVEMKEEEETGTKPHIFTKNPVKTSTPSLPPIRRPTGISVGLTDTLTEETSSDQDVPVTAGAVPIIDPEKKVAFNEVVEKIDEIGGGDEQIEPPDGLLSVADRRPTQFVFAYPLETGVLDTPEDSEESSDYQVSESPENPPEKKKSVIFNEHIERMHIEPLEDNEDAESESESNSANDDPKMPKSTSELQIESEKQLPSEILKEIF